MYLGAKHEVTGIIVDLDSLSSAGKFTRQTSLIDSVLVEDNAYCSYNWIKVE